ncbi:fungal-specific transcription factor domain-containing protein [Xylariales sp. PMI_506]|nr:fungal-specific transcription factor domain-containing protein [Xylariales sp. PMI_506]
MAALPSQLWAIRKSEEKPESRRTNRACTECTRRKIRCNGSLPCKNCQNYGVEDKCVYKKRNTRTNPSWNTIRQLNEALDARTQLLHQILPAVDFAKVPGLSWDQVVRMIAEEPGTTATSTPGRGVPDATAATAKDFGDEEENQQDWDEAPNNHEYETPVGDATNGFTMQLPSSSIESSSVLRALFIACPPSRRRFLDLRRSFLRKQDSLLSGAQVRDAELLMMSESQQHPSPSFVSSQEKALDAFFEIVHPNYPMFDEAWFRNTVSSQERTDIAWKALSDVVFALGSIAAGDHESHFFYYTRVRDIIGLKTFVAGNLEMLQALILLGGLYLYYINSPNTAYVVMGTAFRIAIAMGLHRKPKDQGGSYSASDPNPGPSPVWSEADIRNRTWWSLVCANSWQGMLLPRPDAHRWDALAMDTPLPGAKCFSESSPSGVVEGGCEDRKWYDTSFRNMVELSIIFQDIQDRMVRLNSMTAREILASNEKLLVWSRSHLSQPQTGISGSSKERRGRDRQKVLLEGFVLFMARPHLVHLASTTEPQSFEEEDWHVIMICINTASSMVDTVDATYRRDRVSVWLSTFHLFQACMVLLLSATISKRIDRFTQEAVNDWLQDLKRAIHLFKDMAPYTRPADRYGEVVESFYDSVLAFLQGPAEGKMQLGSTCDEGVMATSLETLTTGFAPIPAELFQEGTIGADMVGSWFDSHFTFGEADLMNWNFGEDSGTFDM